MDHINTLTQSPSHHTANCSPVASIAVNSHNNNNNNNNSVAPGLSPLLQTQISSTPPAICSPSPPPPTPPTITTSSSSLVNLFDGFTSRVSGERNIVESNDYGGVTSGSLVSLTSIGSLGTTANAFYSSIGLAFNSITSPISAAAAAATATTAEAAAVVVAAASAISNHLSSPTNGTPPHLNEDIDDDDEEEEEDCDGDEEDEDEKEEDSPVAARTIKKTWAEIKTNVNHMRKQLANMSSLVPTNIQFRRLSDGRIRCYFLSTPPNAWETTLLYTDIQNTFSTPTTLENTHVLTYNTHTIATKNHVMQTSECVNNCASGGSSMSMDVEFQDVMTMTMNSTPQLPASPLNSSPTQMSGFLSPAHSNKRLQWNLVLQHPITNVVSGVTGAAGASNVWSREYQLLQERKRLSTWGITSYELHKPSGKIVFPCFSDLYQCLDTGFGTSPLFPTQLRTCPQWAALDPQVCPQNSDLIAYISGCDIWITHTMSGHEERLTFAHDGRRPFADDPLSAGVPSYVMQEEFSRYQGYWWQPQSTDGIYRIVYEEVDESDVCLYTFPSSQAIPGEMDEYRFPRTGTHNAKSKLKLVQFTLNETLQISDICIKDLPYSLTSVLPWLEYIVRVGWTPDSN